MWRGRSQLDSSGMARGIDLKRCHSCDQSGFVAWDVDLFSCGREVCEALAFAEMRRRHGDVCDLAVQRLVGMVDRHPHPHAAAPPRRPRLA
jgi:hypothetical protein